MKSAMVYAFVVLLIGTAYAQPRLDTWRLYDAGDSEIECFNDIYRLSEGGYFVCGQSGHRRWLMKLDDEGDPEWNRIGDSLAYYSVIETDRHEAFVGGKIADRFGAELFDQNGEYLWRYLSRTGRCDAVIELKDGNLALAGWSSHQGCITLLTPDGELVWERLFGNAEDYFWFRGLRETEGGIVAVGMISESRGVVIKVNFNGETLWEQIFTDERRCSFTSLVSLQDGFMIGGISNRDWGGYQTTAFIMTKINPEGEMEFQRSYPQGPRIAHWLLCIAKTTEEDLLLAGYSYHYPRGGVVSYYPHLIRTDSDGDTLWINRFIAQAEEQHDSHNKWLNSVIVEEDEIITLCGEFRNPDDNGRGQDALLAKLVPDRVPPRILFKIPEEDTLSLLQGTDQFFAVKIRNPAHLDLAISWSIGDSIVAIQADTSLTISFDSIGDFDVECRIDAGEWVRTASWFVKVRGLFITAKSPDSSSVTIWQSDTSTFSIDSIAVVNNDGIGYSWTLMNLNDMNRHPIGDSSWVDVIIEQTGHYYLLGEVSQNESLDSVAWSLEVIDLKIMHFLPEELNHSVRRGNSLDFALDLVAAVEGDPVQYQWTLTNLDNFEREDAGGDAGVTVEFLRSGNYQMEGLAYRGESSDNVIWTIAVRSAILDFWPRELNLSVPPDSSGEFGVIPFNPESDSLNYRWEVDGDSVGSDSTVAVRFAWDDRRIGNPPHLVAAIVMDGKEGDTVRWEVTVQDPNATPPSIKGGEVPATFGIVSVSPNPFNNSTTIRFTVPFGSESAVRLTVHDLTGREVERLVDERAQQSPPSRGGPYAITFNGKELPAGIYLVRLQMGERQKVVKIVLVR